MRHWMAWIVAATLALGATQALAEPVLCKEDMDARRWMDDADVVAGEVAAGDRVDVVYREGGWIRVRLAGPGAGFGWLPDSAVTEVDSGDTGFDLGLPGLDLPGRNPGLTLPGGFPGATGLPGGATVPGGTSLPPVNLDIE
ncbi:MAG: hypothetical protein QGH45_12145 [Myxococcota bacterium]|nr:hypothetical protein [Myxococcota bacterium]